MRKRFLVLASVAAMALAGTTMPAFAADSTTATSTASLVPITCTVHATSSTGTTDSSYTIKVSPQLATYLTASTPKTVTYLGVTTTVNCGK